ncbi:GIY-YIG nuclease family protein [Geomonas oryzae]|uniref:GIY-YIG nuclease family protein n=1 Tax=Geomonas oryzae TaxID=2364273 RepID=UPI00100A61F8|nr:GIY-YIG nuclease family protein [Geomonas oryzae]
MGKPGYLYALINPALEGLVKVGKTGVNPDKRANELSTATGVPMQFMVAYSVIVSDCDLAEKYAHGLLEKDGYRVSSNREFFRAPVSVAINVIETTANFIGTLSEDEFKSLLQERPSGRSNIQAQQAWLGLESEAYEYWYHGWRRGPERTCKEYKEHVNKCIALWSRAAEAGSIRSYYMLGSTHLDYAEQLESEINNNRTFWEKLFGDDRAQRRCHHINEGLECHRLALKNGYEMSYAALASYFGSANNVSEAKKHWDYFFQSPTFRNRLDPHDDFSLYVISYHNFLFINLNIEYNEANYLANQKFDT